jgi:thioredoxin 1
LPDSAQFGKIVANLLLYRARDFFCDKMKILPVLILCFVSMAAADDFKLLNGNEYKNATVSRVVPDGIVLVTSAGISKIYFVELPKEVRERFHYNAMKAAAYSAQEDARQNAYQQQQEQLRRKLAEQTTRYWTGQDPAKTQKGSPQLQVAAVADRGQQVEVITHGAAVDITKHLAHGHVTIVDFYADWCGPCKQLSPTLEQMAQTDQDIALRKIDIVNWNTAVAQQYNIRSIPQVNVYSRGGDLVGTVVGVKPEEVKRYVAQAKASG